MVLPDWLEPLWGLWIAGRGVTPRTKVKEEDLTKLAADDVNGEYSLNPSLKMII